MQCFFSFQVALQPIQKFRFCQKKIQETNIFMAPCFRKGDIYWATMKETTKCLWVKLTWQMSALHSRGPRIKFRWYLLKIFWVLENCLFGMAVSSDSVSGYEAHSYIRFMPSLRRFSCRVVVPKRSVEQELSIPPSSLRKQLWIGCTLCLSHGDAEWRLHIRIGRDQYKLTSLPSELQSNLADVLPRSDWCKVRFNSRILNVKC